MFKEFIEYITKNLVDVPENVKVEEIIQDSKVIVKLIVSKEDLGKIIGKQGKTIKSLRVLFTAIAAKHNKSGQLEINEE
jgi:uncharacterized protein